MLTAYLAATIFDMSVFDLAASAATAAPSAPAEESWFDFWLDLVQIVVPILGLVAILYELHEISKQNRKQEQANHSSMMLDLADRWSTVLAKRYEVMKKLADPVANRIDIEKDFANDVSTLMNSDFWRHELRPVINFYEFLGLMIHQDNITADEAFVLVSVDHFDWQSLREEEGKERADTSFKDGDFYKKVQPYLDLLRDYRNDIYVFYDLYLAELYHANRLRPFLPSHPLDSGKKLKFNEKTCRYYWDRSAA